MPVTRSGVGGVKRLAPSVESPLATSRAHRADAAQESDLAVAIWQRIDACLSSVFGPQGVAALLVRSLHLAQPEHPWLLEAQPKDAGTNDFEWLRQALAQREPAMAVAANSCLLETFCALLAKLIGAPLAEQLLEPVWLASIHGISA